MKHIKEWVKTIVIAVAIALIINNFIIVNAIIPTRSMEPTIHVNDRLFAFRLSYLLSDPDRGDVIVFESNHEDKLLVKRVIGLPGETVEVKEGTVYIDGTAIEDYTDVVALGNFGPYTVPENAYFMLGDNRNKSEDSRYWTNPYIDKSLIKGKAIIKYYPNLQLF